jgi:hypothetical protein
MYFPEDGLHFTASVQFQYSVKVYIKKSSAEDGTPMLFYQSLLSVFVEEEVPFLSKCRIYYVKISDTRVPIKIDFHSTNWGILFTGSKISRTLGYEYSFRLGHRLFKWTVHISEALVSMDEGTLKTPIPKCRLHWSVCLGWCNFVGSESGQKQSVKLLQNMVYNTTQHPPPPHSHTLYNSFVHGGNSS